MTQRREFLKFLAASPLLTDFSVFAQEVEETLGSRLTDPREVINVFEMQALAREKIPPAHYGYLATGVDSDGTIKANRAGFSRFQIKPRRLVDVSQVDTSVSVLGTEVKSPIFLCPVGSQGAYHADAELGTARAARAKGHHMILSTVSSTAIEAVAEARDAPIWFQLYATPGWEMTVAMVKRAEAAGCSAVCLTIDLPGGRNVETQALFAREDERDCSVCHNSQRKPKPMRQTSVPSGQNTSWDWRAWDVIERLKSITNMKVILKGIEAEEDAALAVKHGADAIVLSNHGGRAVDSARGTIECLPDVSRAVNGRIPIVIDGGFRRGTDIYKALAMGASAVGIGRPYCFGLGAFGQQGVERVLDLLNRELEITMVGSGTPTLASITPNHIIDTSSRQTI
jgi:isopentenyl diphosphate isomerase/L-lactate dehydrogenase-like FMN-dependent dehydrogenase